jgi:hypothetical protein
LEQAGEVNPCNAEPCVMDSSNLEERVARLESEFQGLRAEVGAAPGPEGKDWRRTIGMFTEEPGMQAILQEAMRLRATDRRRAKRKPAGRKRSKS